jgi:hypothetical protein
MVSCFHKMTIVAPCCGLHNRNENCHKYQRKVPSSGKYMCHLLLHYNTVILPQGASPWSYVCYIGQSLFATQQIQSGLYIVQGL